LTTGRLRGTIGASTKTPSEPFMNDDRPSFARGAVRPIECFKAGWELIKNDYWLMLGITAVGMLIASVAPLGILLGPMMCGIFYCLLRRANGRLVKFEMLFRGFDHFVQSLIATMIMIVPMIAIMVPAYLGFIVAVLSAAPQKPGAPPDPNAAKIALVAYGAFLFAIIGVSIVVNVLFFFIYPLIVDRRLTGVQAVGTSIRAAWANLGGVLGIVLLNTLFDLVGYLACCVGLFFVMPLHYAAIAVAYRAVFPPDVPPEAPAEGPAADYDDARLDAPPEG
jgi:large-conductance mechanosensitive channel